MFSLKAVSKRGSLFSSMSGEFPIVNYSLTEVIFSPSIQSIFPLSLAFHFLFVMQHKPTLVIGVSRNPYRYANMAVKALKAHGHPVYAIGREAFIFENVQVSNEWKDINRLHTITLYIRPELQKAYYDKILSSGAQRIIFNPGTWNNELAALVATAGMEVEDACTLAMLSSGQF